MKYLAQDVRQFLAGNLRLAELDAQPERVVLRPEIEQERLGAIRSRWAFLSAGLPSFVPQRERYEADRDAPAAEPADICDPLDPEAC